MRSLPLLGGSERICRLSFDNFIAEAVGYLHCQICSRGPMCEIAATWQTRPSIPDALRIPLIDLPINRDLLHYRADQIQYGSIPIAAESAAARPLSKT